MPCLGTHSSCSFQASSHNIFRGVGSGACPPGSLSSQTGRPTRRLCIDCHSSRNCGCPADRPAARPRPGTAVSLAGEDPPGSLADRTGPHARFPSGAAPPAPQPRPRGSLRRDRSAVRTGGPDRPRRWPASPRIRARNGVHRDHRRRRPGVAQPAPVAAMVKGKG